MAESGMGGHHLPIEGLKDEWLTPPGLIQALGPFDLDPCAPVHRPWPMAAHHYTVEDDGLMQPWHGLVWLNPPYGKVTWQWLHKLSVHEPGGIALTFARTETRGFFNEVWDRASALLFLRGRLVFFNVDGTPGAGNAGAPSVLVAYGAEATRRLRAHAGLGVFVHEWSHSPALEQAELFS